MWFSYWIISILLTALAVADYDPLYDAVFMADEDAVRALVNRDHSILMAGVPEISASRIDTEYNRTALMMCGMHPSLSDTDMKCVKIAMYLNSLNVNYSHVDKFGWDTLHMASVRGLTKFAELMIQKGCNINRYDTHGRTPLMKSIAHGHQNTMKLLLQYGADPTLSDHVGANSYHYSVQLASSNDSYSGMLEYLLSYAHVPLLDEFRDNHNRTPLMHAIIGRANASVINLLLKHNSDPTLCDGYGISSISMSQTSEIKNLLLEATIEKVNRDHRKWLESQQQEMRHDIISTVQY
jgi:ankyrin repeat protein